MQKLCYKTCIWKFLLFLKFVLATKGKFYIDFIAQ